MSDKECNTVIVDKDTWGNGTTYGDGGPIPSPPWFLHTHTHTHTLSICKSHLMGVNERGLTTDNAYLYSLHFLLQCKEHMHTQAHCTRSGNPHYFHSLRAVSTHFHPQQWWHRLLLDDHGILQSEEITMLPGEPPNTRNWIPLTGIAPRRVNQMSSSISTWFHLYAGAKFGVFCTGYNLQAIGNYSWLPYTLSS